MNWYRRFKKAQSETDFRGEFWLLDGGMAISCDGNIDDVNHEAVAIQTAQQMIMESEDNWDEWKKEAATTKYQIALTKAVTPQEKQQIQAQWNEDNGEEFLMEALRERSVDNEVYQTAEGMGDPRMFAMKYLKWKRLTGNNVETWTLTPTDMRDIANGLWEAYQDEVEIGEFNIDVRSTGKWYNDVPFQIISEGNFQALENLKHR